MKSPKDFAEELASQFDRLKPNADSIGQFHRNFRRAIDQFDQPGPRMQNIIDLSVPDPFHPVPARLYEPFGCTDTAGPTLIYIHGGGFVTCSVESHEGICLRIANGSGYRVLSVEYRLAPAHPYPAGPDDCETVLKWALSGDGEAYGIDPNRLAIGGDSAGGNMAAFLAQKYRRELRAQILLYPLMQLVELKPVKPGPQDILPLGYIALKFIDEHYVQNADTHNPRLSPLLERNLHGTPPAYILTCGLDPLRMEGHAYAQNLEAAGTKVKSHYEKTMPHGFLNFAKAFPRAIKVPLDAADFLRMHMPLKEATC